MVLSDEMTPTQKKMVAAFEAAVGENIPPSDAAQLVIATLLVRIADTLDNLAGAATVRFSGHVWDARGDPRP